MRRFLVVLLLLDACTMPETPSTATPVTLPPAALAEWAKMEALTGRTGDSAGVTWLVVPGRAWTCPESPNGYCAGLWVAPATIYLSEDAVRDSLPRIITYLSATGAVTVDTTPAWSIVRHEMLHVLLRDGTHTNVAWSRCRCLVS